MSRFQFYIKGAVWLGILAIWLTGCNRPDSTGTQTSAPTLPQSASPAAETPVSPTAPATATPPPLAARVNGYEISIAEYEAEVAQVQAIKGAELSPEEKQRVLDQMTDSALLAQAAIENSFQLDESQIDARISELAAASGGQAGLDAWMQANGYNPESFRRALRREMAAAWMRDRIITAVPLNAEQVHARQILLYNADEAQDVYSQLQAGSNFGNLAVKYDPVTSGDLGWFPRGYLTDPKLDDAVFPLEIGTYSPVVETAAGFHILQLLEREADRPLSPEAILMAQTRAVQDWLQQQRSESQIEVLLP